MMSIDFCAHLGLIERFLCTFENDIYGFFFTFRIALIRFCTLLRIFIDFCALSGYLHRFLCTFENDIYRNLCTFRIV